MLSTICIVLRLNEVELLQWYLFVYLFVKDDIIFSQNGKILQFERCYEMIISSAIFAKAINNQGDPGQKEEKYQKSEHKFDQDSLRLIESLSLDHNYLQRLFYAVIE